MAEPTGEQRLGADFQRVLAASTISNLGDGMTLAAVPLLAASLTRDPFLVSLVGVAQYAPWLAFSLVSGALVDRLDRRRVMWRVDLFRAAVIGTVGLLVGVGEMTLAVLCGAVLLLGTAETLFDNAAQAILPALVERPLLGRANGRLMGAEIVANQFAGPLLGSLLFTVAVATPFLTDAGTYLIAALLVALIPGNYRASRTASGSEGVTGIGHDVAEGLRWLWRHRLLRTLAIALGAANLASGAMGVMVLFAQDVLGVDESRYGLLLATYAVGGVAGSMLANPIAGRLGAGQAMLGSMAVLGAGLVAVGLLSSAWLVGAVNVSFGAATVVWNVLTVSLRQSVIPDDILGRVNSAYRFVSWGATPVGFLAGGLLADGFGLRAPFLAGGLVVLGLVALMAPVVNNHSVEAALRTEEIE